MKNIFTYGSLMCEDIMMEVSGIKLSFSHGTLKRYRRLCVKNEFYPAIIPDNHYTVTGIVYFSLTGSAWKRLDRFEGEMYSRETVRVELINGEICHAETYVFKSRFKEYLDNSDWSFPEFLHSGKTSFINNYKGYHLL